MRFYQQWDQAAAEYEREISAIDCQKANDGMTLQEPTEDCDINVLIKRMGVKDGSMLPRWENPNQLYDVDLSELPEDPTIINNIMRAGTLKFMTLPAEVRGRFENEPAKLYAFMQDEKNRPDAERMGLLAPIPQKTKPEPLDVRVIPAATA